METPKIFDSELRFCEILWSHEPIKSSELVRLCAEELGWKKNPPPTPSSKRLTERGVVHTENAVVTALVARRTCSAPRAVPSWPTTFTAACRHF